MWIIHAKIQVSRVFRRKCSTFRSQCEREKSAKSLLWNQHPLRSRKKWWKIDTRTWCKSSFSTIFHRSPAQNSDRKSVIRCLSMSVKWKKWKIAFSLISLSIPLNHILCKYHYNSNHDLVAQMSVLVPLFHSYQFWDENRFRLLIVKFSKMDSAFASWKYQETQSQSFMFKSSLMSRPSSF